MLRGWKLLTLLGLAGSITAALNHAAPTTAHDNGTDHDHAVTYFRDIQPILARHCMGCHVEGGIGPVSFEDPLIVRFGSDSIAAAVETGDMPPWMPGPDNPPLVGDRRLSQEEIDLILAWDADDAPLGSPEQAVAAEPSALPQVRDDLVLQMAVPYEPDYRLYDDYRCFLLDPDLPEDRFITGYSVQPGQPSLVHHVLLFQVDESAREEALARDAEDDRPGWECFGGPGVSIGRGASGAISQGAGVAGSIGGWAPGVQSVFFPEGTGNLLRADGLVVMQVHYNLEAGAAPDQTRVIMQFAGEGEPMIALTSMNLVAPVEIPCPAGAAAPECDRDVAIALAVREDGARAAARTQGFLRLCGRSAEDYLFQNASHVESTCDYTVPQEVLAVGATGHMHVLGREFSIVRNPGAPDEQILLHIPAWDFHWQGSYQYVDPIRLNRGDVIRITCVWDNSEGERYVIWGEGTRDEMCLGAVTLRPLPEE